MEGAFPRESAFAVAVVVAISFLATPPLLPLPRLVAASIDARRTVDEVRGTVAPAVAFLAGAAFCGFFFFFCFSGATLPTRFFFFFFVLVVVFFFATSSSVEAFAAAATALLFLFGVPDAFFAAALSTTTRGAVIERRCFDTVFTFLFTFVLSNFIFSEFDAVTFFSFSLPLVETRGEGVGDAADFPDNNAIRSIAVSFFFPFFPFSDIPATILVDAAASARTVRPFSA